MECWVSCEEMHHIKNTTWFSSLAFSFFNNPDEWRTQVPDSFISSSVSLSPLLTSQYNRSFDKNVFEWFLTTGWSGTCGLTTSALRLINRECFTLRKCWPSMSAATWFKCFIVLLLKASWLVHTANCRAVVCQARTAHMQKVGTKQGQDHDQRNPLACMFDLLISGQQCCPRLLTKKQTKSSGVLRHVNFLVVRSTVCNLKQSTG